MRLAASGAGARGSKGTLRRAALLRALRRRVSFFPNVTAKKNATLPCFTQGQSSHAILRTINNKESYASRLAPRSPSSGANDDESPPS